MRILLVMSLVFLASCTGGTNTDSKGNTSTTSNTQTSNTNPTENRTIPAPTYGSGKTQIEIFADFQCPACIATNESIQPIFEEYAKAGKLTIVFRQFPLTSIHKNAKGDAIAALCSAEQGKYVDYKKGLYALEKSKAGKTVTDEERVAIAKSLGMDEAKFSTCLTNRAYEKQVESDIALGESKGVNGTPTMYLDGIKLDMSLFKDLDGFRSFLESRMK